MGRIAMCLSFGIISSLSATGAIQLADRDGKPMLSVGTTDLFVLSAPWIANSAWKSLYQFPETLDGTVTEREGLKVITTVSRGPHGSMIRKVTTGVEGVTIRFEFELAPIEGAAHLQWVLRLEPEVYDGTMVEGKAKEPVALRPLAGAHLAGLESARIFLSRADLHIEVSAGDGEWRLQDARKSPWAKCYRLEYNRDFALNGTRKGWIELNLRGESVESPFVPLSEGIEEHVKSAPFCLGPVTGKVDASLAAIAVWHTAQTSTRKGETVGRMTVTFVDGDAAVFPFVWENEVTSSTDDPRDMPNGLLAPDPDGKPAWLTCWRNPQPDRMISSIAFQNLEAGWHALAATGIRADVDNNRVTATLSGLQSVTGPGEESVISLDGIWGFDPTGDMPAVDVTVPGRWELLKGCRNVHEATYSREFDVPLSWQGQRIFLRFDAVGEFCDVRVNGLSAGQRLVGPVPVEFDITGLLTVPSQGNRLEVIVKDDTHFSVPKPSSDWRNRRHWIPHGIGGNNRKGLFQHVTLRSRPPVFINDVRVQTSVSNKHLTVIYEIFNSRRETVKAKLGASVRSVQGGTPDLIIPEISVELPGQLTSTVTLDADWPSPRLWQPNDPYLYQLRSIFSDVAGTRLQRVDTRFGFREVWFEGIHFYLNGIRCNLRGESPSYAQNAGPLETREGTEGLVRTALAANFNVLRFHAAPAPPHVYDVCDELGMLVIDESAIYASWGMIMPENPAWLPACRNHLQRWVRRDRNHPAIILWSAENEGLNVNQLSPGQLSEFKRVIDDNDGTRPVIFDGDGTGYGASLASVKHYVKTIEDLKNEGGKASGYGRDLRNDIYWAAPYKQPIPLGIGEFLFPANDAMRAQRPAVCAAMGLQTRGYRYANWFDIRPYNPHYTGAFEASGVKDEYAEAWDTIVKSFAAVAVFDKAYDELGPFPDPPVLRAGKQARRTLIIYNDTFADETVTVAWRMALDGTTIAEETRDLQIPLGDHVEIDIMFVPSKPGKIDVTLTSAKQGKLTFQDVKSFIVR